jgi:hypothetical protein
MCNFRDSWVGGSFSSSFIPLEKILRHASSMYFSSDCDMYMSQRNLSIHLRAKHCWCIQNHQAWKDNIDTLSKTISFLYYLPCLLCQIHKPNQWMVSKNILLHSCGQQNIVYQVYRDIRCLSAAILQSIGEVKKKCQNIDIYAHNKSHFESHYYCLSNMQNYSCISFTMIGS